MSQPLPWTHSWLEVALLCGAVQGQLSTGYRRAWDGPQSALRAGRTAGALSDGSRRNARRRASPGLSPPDHPPPVRGGWNRPPTLGCAQPPGLTQML